MYRRLLITIPVAILFGLTQLFSQEATLPNEVIASIEKRIEYGLNPSIAIGIISPEGSSYHNYGYTNEGGKPVDEHTVYEIGSITKVFTGILLAQQVINGEVALDDPAEKYLTGGKSIPVMGDQPVTLGHLSDHTSGIPRMPSNFAPADPANPYIDYTEDLMLEFLTTYTPSREVGAEYEYSNLAQGFLGYILAGNANTSYEELLKDVITGPLGMNETTITLDDTMRAKLAIGHNNGVAVSNWDLDVLAGAGGIRSTTSDMVTFLSANLGLIETDLKAAMELAMKKRHTKGADGVGLGWHMVERNGKVAYTHSGGTGGYRTFAAMIPAEKKGVVVFANSTVGAEDLGMFLLGMTDELREVKPLLAHKVGNIIDEQGVDEAWIYFNQVKEDSLDFYDASENSFNDLGYTYLNDNLDAALAVFKMNVELYPEAFNVYDSYGEALLKAGNKEEGIANYKKSIEINPGNTHGIDVLKELGINVDIKDVSVPDDVLSRYTGTYAIQPAFKVEITKEGSQLYAQATGQQRFEIFPKSETEFYWKVVPARLVFNLEGENVVSFTLFQNGAEVAAVKE